MFCILKGHFQLLLSFHSEIPFKSGLCACMWFFSFFSFFFSSHNVRTGHGNFLHCVCSGDPVQCGNSAFGCLSQYKGPVWSSVHFNGGHGCVEKNETNRFYVWFLQGRVPRALGFLLMWRSMGLGAGQQWVKTLFLYEIWANDWVWRWLTILPTRMALCNGLT